MPGTVYDSTGARRRARQIAIYDAAGNRKYAKKGWRYNAIGNREQIYSTGGLYFIDDLTNYARFYDFDRNRQSNGDINLGTGAWNTGAAAAGRLYLVSGSTARAISTSGARESRNDISLGSGVYDKGGFQIGDGIYFVGGTAASGQQQARRWSLSGVRQASMDISLGNLRPWDSDADDDRIYLLVNVGGGRRGVLSWSHTGVRDTNVEFSLTAGKSYRGLCAVEGGIYVVNDTDNRAQFYNIPAKTPNTRLDISLGAGTWRGAMASG